MPKRPTENITQQLQEEEELGTVGETKTSLAEAAPVERPSTSESVASEEKAKVEEEAWAEYIRQQAEIVAELQELRAEMLNIIDLIGRVMNVYASILVALSQAFPDNTVFGREVHDLAQEYNAIRQDNILNEESGEEWGEEDVATEDSEEWMSEDAD